MTGDVTMFTLGFVALVAVCAIAQLCWYYSKVQGYKYRFKSVSSNWHYATTIDNVLVALLFVGELVFDSMYIETGFLLAYLIVMVKVYALQKLYEDDVGAIPLLKGESVAEWLLRGNRKVRVVAALLWPMYDLVRMLFTYRKSVEVSRIVSKMKREVTNPLRRSRL